MFQAVEESIAPGVDASPSEAERVGGDRVRRRASSYPREIARDSDSVKQASHGLGRRTERERRAGEAIRLIPTIPMRQRGDRGTRKAEERLTESERSS